MNETGPAAGKPVGTTGWGTLVGVHMQNHRTETADPYVLVGEPWAAADGSVQGPQIQVWPLGQGTELLLTFSLDEAQTLVERVLGGLEEAQALFPEPGQT